SSTNKSTLCSWGWKCSLRLPSSIPRRALWSTTERRVMMTDCRTFHYDLGRLGQGAGAPEGADWHKYLAVSLGSAVRSAPLYLSSWLFQHGRRAGQQHNIVYIATSDNHVHAFAEDELRAGSSMPIWSQWLGKPVTRAGSNNPPPVGICSTPVLDPDNQRLFV